MNTPTASLRVHAGMLPVTLIALVLTASGGCLAGEAAVYVSPTGSDAHPGTAEKPLATLTKARDTVRAVKADGPKSVVLMAGTFYLSEPLVLGPEDSGGEKAPVKWTAAPGAQVTISGGTPLQLKWEPFKNGILHATVPGVKEGKLDFDQLFVDGKMQVLARYPNYDANAKHYNGSAADCISPERVKKWANPVGGFVHALHAHEWGDFHYVITGVKDGGALDLKGGYQNNRRMGMHKSVRFVENIFEELDAPGEWYLDHKDGTLYFMPPTGMDVSKANFVAAGIKSLIEFRGTREKPVRFITLRGVTLTQTARTFMATDEPLLRSDWAIYRGGAVYFEGAEDCKIVDTDLVNLGGNAVFVNKYDRRLSVTGCKIAEVGASGVCFVGDIGAVRSPLFEYHQSLELEKIDRTPGPKTADYPADCAVRDCLITRVGRIEKQTTGVQIDIADSITVSHCSIYDTPRAGINIGDGCFGGHIVEFCDVFDTVKETGDHGSFNSWGRDRFWVPNYAEMAKRTAADIALVKLDAVKTVTLRNSRWRCDHGWDIDLDDGSTNYHIYNNLCLNGGLKNREGFYRVVENNIMVSNTFHPHVWFPHSHDVFRRNIVFRGYAPIGLKAPWGDEVNNNLLHDAKKEKAEAWTNTGSGRDEHSLTGDAMFVDASRGDYRVKEGSPALSLGFVNFAMDEFGVTSARLRSQARTPELPTGGAAPVAAERAEPVMEWMGAKVKKLGGLDERSSVGIGADARGVLLLDVPTGSAAAKAGLVSRDVVLKWAGNDVGDFDSLQKAYQTSGGPVEATIYRAQKSITLRLTAKE